MGFLRLMAEFIRRDWKIQLSYRFQAFFRVAAIFSVCVTFFFVSIMLRRVEGDIVTLDKYGGSYFAFAIVGLAVSSYIDSSLRTFSGSIRQAQMTGTFEAMLATRTSIHSIVAGSGLFTLFYSAVRSSVLIFFGVIVFGMSVHLDVWPSLLLTFVLTVVATLAMGIFSAGFIALFKQGDPLTAAISGLSWLLSGVVYPKEILPSWVQRVADLLPATHALEAVRLALLAGDPASALRRSWAYLAVFCVVAMPLSLLWFRFAVGRARIAGSLARY